jgi:hypothetical protein
VADLGAGLQDHEVQALALKVPGHGQPGLAAPDHDHIQLLIAPQVLPALVLGGGHRAASRSRATLKLNIMPLCMCSAM